MKALDPSIKDAVLNEHRRGASPAQLASKYGISAGTVKSWIQRAKVASKDASRRKKKMHPDATESKSQEPTQRRPGAPLGNKNAVGNRGGYGGPPGNKKAVSTHEYESILFDVLPDEDKEAWLRVNTDKLAQLDTEIRATEIRERRMLQRIESLRNDLHTMVKYEEEQTSLLTGGGTTEMPATVTKRKYEGTLGQIQAIEEALTRVQAHKARLIELQHKFAANNEDEDGIEEFKAALNGAGEVWDGQG